MLSKYAAKASELAHKRQIELSQSTAIANAEAAQAAEAAKSQNIQLATQGKLQEIQMQGQVDLAKSREEHGRNRELLMLENELHAKRELNSIKENNRNRLDQ
jgi:plasmid replication initiation protein